MKTYAFAICLLLAACAAGKPEPAAAPIQTLSQVPAGIAPIPKFHAPSGVKDGSFGGKASNGRTFKTVVKNGYFDLYMDVYHPNGKLHSHTPLTGGVAQGWSEGYTEQGKLRTKVLYRDGKAVKALLFDERGNVVKELK